MERIRERIEKKYALKINNPLGHNKYTSKKDLVKIDKALSDLKVFEKLRKDEQYDVLNKMGNQLWREGKDYRAKRSKFTMMQKLFFGWDFE